MPHPDSLRTTASILAALLLSSCSGDSTPTRLAVEAIPLPPGIERADPPIQRQFERARSSLAEALSGAEAGPLASAYGELGELYQAYGHCGIAPICYEQAAALEPKEPRWAYLMGACRREKARFEESNAWLERMLALRPDYAPAKIRLGMNQLSLGDREAARTTFTEILAADAENVRALLELGRLELEDGRPETAIDLLVRAAASQPEVSGTHHALALAYRSVGDLDRAEEHASRVATGRWERKPVEVHDPYAARVDSRRLGARVHHERSLAARRRGRPDVAVVELRQAIAADPDRDHTLLDLAQLLVALDRFEEAQVEVDKLLYRQPRHALGRLLKARLLEEARDQQGAETLIRAVLGEDAGLREAQMALGRLLIRQRRWGEALPLLERAAEIAPAWDEPRIEIARCLVLAGTPDLAWERVSRALKSVPDSPILKAVAARVALASATEIDTAARLAVESTHWAPSLVALETMAMVQARRGESEPAEAWQQLAVRLASKARHREALELARRRLGELESTGRIESPFELDESLDATLVAAPATPLPFDLP